MLLLIQFLWAVLVYGGFTGVNDPFPPITTDIDVLRYVFGITLQDDSNTIEGEAIIDFQYTRNNVQTVLLDLVNPGKHNYSDVNPFFIDPELPWENLTEINGMITGMKVTKVECDAREASFTHVNDVLRILTSGSIVTGQKSSCTVSYIGVPGDGLIIGTNKYNRRTFFGDNWPNRAHHWLPCIDHPSNKAIVEWRVNYPAHYGIIANGRREYSFQKGETRTTHFISKAPLPTKVMVIGVASFASEAVGHTDQGTEVTSWVYPENREEGFYDYALGLPILNYLTNLFGPFSYAKLANVQSKTRYGGMENAGCIFYSEGSVTGTRSSEKLIVHETVHQFFGDSASELEWLHVWLSEGFATYFTHYYVEAYYGREQFVSGLKTDRQSIFRYEELNPGSSVVDSNITNLNGLLNTNSYQKGGWVLHMLRYLMGDVPFITGVRSYYDKFQNSNALTEDLRKEMEEASDRNLELFFNQWVYGPGHMDLYIEWDHIPEDETLYIRITQNQRPTLFVMPLEFTVCTGLEHCLNFTVNIEQTTETFVFSWTLGHPDDIQIDPNTWLLVESNIKKRSDLSWIGEKKIIKAGNLRKL